VGVLEPGAAAAVADRHAVGDAALVEAGEHRGVRVVVEVVGAGRVVEEECGVKS
jgi:hypothetical protein